MSRLHWNSVTVHVKILKFEGNSVTVHVMILKFEGA
jgi:hypothetical protein